MAIKILGAGLSGLSAAINLKKAGKEVLIYEKNPDVGMQTYPNYQVFVLKEKLADYLNSINLNPKVKSKRLNKVLFCTRKREINVTLKEPITIVERGGKNSIEYGLYNQAKSLKTDFKFKKILPKSEADIIATGTYRCDAAAFGGVYEGLNFPKNKFLYMHDDRYSPKGWYFYILPLPGNKHELVNCTSQPYVKKTKELFFKAIKERKVLSDIVDGKKPIETFGGIGGFNIPKTAVKNGALYVGEAAGFQDCARGFGMDYALESGYLAAKSIVENLDYDSLWKARFKARIEKNLYRRFALSTFGDTGFEYAMRNVREGDLLDFDKILPRGSKEKLIKALFSRLEIIKKHATGYW